MKSKLISNSSPPPHYSRKKVSFLFGFFFSHQNLFSLPKWPLMSLVRNIVWKLMVRSEGYLTEHVALINISFREAPFGKITLMCIRIWPWYNNCYNYLKWNCVFNMPRGNICLSRTKTWIKVRIIFFFFLYQAEITFQGIISMRYIEYWEIKK